MDTRLFRLYFAPTIFACAVPTFYFPAQTPLGAAEPTSSSTEEKPTHADSDRPLARKVIGVWTREAVPLGWAPNVIGTQYKFFTDKYWVVTHADKSGFTIYAHGGTYQLEGDKQIGTIVFSTLYNAGMIGQSHECKIDISEDTFWQIGIDNDYTEKWTKTDGGEKSQLNRDLMGVWTRADVPFDDARSAKGTQYKFFGGKQWIALHTNEQGVALTAHGGTYELDGNQCTEQIVYSTQFDTLPIGKVSKFKIAVEGDNLSNSNLDSQATEKWTRAK